MEIGAYEGVNYAAILWRWKWRIGLLILIFMVAAGGVSFFLPRTYRSSAILLILPPKFETELKVSILSVPVYQSILQSDDILEKVAQRMKREGILSSEQGIGDLGDLKVETVQVARGKQAESILKLVVTSGRPEKAASVANAWAAAFVEHYQELTGAEATRLRSYIFREYDVAKANLEAAEDALMKFESKYNLPLVKQTLQVSVERLAGAAASMGTPKEGLQLRLANLREEIAAKKKTLEEKKRQVAEMEEGGLWVGLVKRWPGVTPEPKEGRSAGPLYVHTEASRDLLMRAEEARRKFQEERRPDFLGAEIERKRQVLIDYGAELSNTQMQLKTTQEALAETAKQLAQTPRLLTLSKAITDDPLWEAVLSKVSEEELKKLGDLILRREVMNPHYLNLDRQLVDFQVACNTLGPRATFLEAEIEKRSKELAEAEAQYCQALLDLHRLDKAVEVAQSHYDALGEKHLLTKIEVADLEMETAVLRAQEVILAAEVEKAGLEIAQLQKEYSEKMMERTRLVREQDRLKATFDLMAQKKEAARMAEAEEAAEVKIAGRAVVPGRPHALKRMVIILGAGLAALILGIFLAFFFEAVSTERVKQE